MDSDTDEAIGCQIAEFSGLKFIIGFSSMRVEGSLHKYRNGGSHNYNQFNRVELLAVLTELEAEFGINPKTATLHNVEFGVNITSEGISTVDLVEGLEIHQSMRFKWFAISDSNFKQCEHTQYFLKAYDKALQYDLSGQLFRWEMKVFKMKKLQNFKIFTLSDLVKPGILDAIGVHLLRLWNDSLFINPSKTAPYPESDWDNPRYWLRLNSQNKRLFQRRKLELEEHERNHENIKAKIHDQIISTWFDLLYPESQLETSIRPCRDFTIYV